MLTLSGLINIDLLFLNILNNIHLCVSFKCPIGFWEGALKENVVSPMPFFFLNETLKRQIYI